MLLRTTWSCRWCQRWWWWWWWWWWHSESLESRRCGHYEQERSAVAKAVIIATHFRLSSLFRSSSTTVYPLIRYEVELNFLLLRRKRCVDSLDIAAHIILRQMRSYEAVGGLCQHGRYEAAAMVVVVGWVRVGVKGSVKDADDIWICLPPFRTLSLSVTRPPDRFSEKECNLSVRRQPVRSEHRSTARQQVHSSANIYHRATMVTNRRIG